MQPQACSIKVSFQVEKETINENRIDKPKYWRMLFRTDACYNPTSMLKQLREDFPKPEHRIIVTTTTSFTVQTTDEIPNLLFYQEDEY